MKDRLKKAEEGKDPDEAESTTVYTKEGGIVTPGTTPAAGASGQPVPISGWGSLFGAAAEEPSVTE